MDFIGEILEFIRDVLRSLLGFLGDLFELLRLPQGTDPKTASLVVLAVLVLLLAGLLLLARSSRK